MISCPQREQYQRLLSGSLDETEEQALDTHVKNCAGCLKLLEELTALSLPPFVPELVDRPSGSYPRSDVLNRMHEAMREAVRLDRAHELAARLRVDPVDDRLPTVPGYRILGILGWGGMGLVYKAEQLDLQRIVALKMIRAGLIADAGSRSRFRTEILAVARVQHPNIVQIFEVGVAEGLPFYSLEYVEGGSLTDRLAGLPQPPRATAELVELVARAAHFAHEHGIVHRDLKPSNILLTAQGAPKIADFGLAKLVDADHTGAAASAAGNAIHGTPCYMAPEQAVPQASGKPIGPAADIYSLGSILYEMLTGHPPFRSQSPLETALQAVHAEPMPPRRVRPDVPLDLETICLKCLSKDPARRYDSALDLAEDLRRFCTGEPIRARPISVAERSWRWTRRNPTVAALLAALAVVVIVGLSAVTWLWRSEAQSATQALAEKQHADDARNQAERLAARSFADLAIVQGDHGNVEQALHFFVKSLGLAVKSEDTALEHSVRLNLAVWRGQLVRKRAELPHDNWVWAAAYSPDGKVCATASRDRTARLWDVATGTPLSEPLRHPYPVWALAFTPDGKELLTGSGDPQSGEGDVRRWQVPTGQPLPTNLPEGAGRRFVFKLVFSADGQTLLIQTGPQVVVCANGKALTLPHPGNVTATALSPNGQIAITGGTDGIARLWQTDSAKPIGEPLNHTGQESHVSAVAFSPDSEWVLTGTTVRDRNKRRFVGGEVRLWRANTGERVGDAWPHPGPVKTVAFSPNGQRALTAAIALEDDAATDKQSLRGAARLWDVGAGTPIGPVMNQEKPIWAAAFSPDGRVLLTGSEGGVAQFWQAATGLPIGTPQPRIGNVNAVAFSPDGKTALTTRTYDTAQATIWQAPQSPADVVPSVVLPNVDLMAFAPDGKTIAAAALKDNKCHLWNLNGDHPSSSPRMLPYPAAIRALAFRADGRMLAIGGDDNDVQLWDPTDGKSLGHILVNHHVLAMDFSRDGKQLLIGNENRETQLYDVARAEPIGPPLSHKTMMSVVAFHPDGKSYLASGDSDTIRRWDAATQKLLGVFSRHQRGMAAVACSPDGSTIATGSYDHTAMLWDSATYQPLCPPLQHQGDVFTTHFRADGKLLLTASQDKTARLWDAATGLRIGPLLTHSGLVRGAFKPNTNQAATQAATISADDGLLRLWDISAPTTGSVQEITASIQALTGKELCEKGILRDLDGLSP